MYFEETSVKDETSLNSGLTLWHFSLRNPVFVLRGDDYDLI